MLTLERTSEQDAFHASISAFLSGVDLDARTDDAVDVVWSGLADLGVLGLAARDSGASAADLVVALDALGRHACPGPVVPTMLAARLLEGSELDDVGAGSTRVALSAPLAEPASSVVMWGAGAGVVIHVDGVSCHRVTALSDRRTVPSMSGEPLELATVDLGPRFDDAAAAEAIAVGDLAVAAWLLGAAGTMLTRGGEHARNRHQFGRPIGSFQAVAHRLATTAAEVGAAVDLTRLAARRFDSAGDRLTVAQARLVATRAALHAAYAVHQVFGALGFSSESGIGRFSAGIRQLSLVAPLAGRARIPRPTGPNALSSSNPSH